MRPRCIGVVGLALSCIGASPSGRWLEPLDSAGVTGFRRGDGATIRLINVWATWCGPCVVELPDLAALARDIPDPRFRVITVTVDEPDDEDKAQGLLEKHRVPGRHCRFTGEISGLAAALDPTWDGALPFALLLGPDGSVLLRSTGPLPVESIRQAVVALPPAPSRPSAAPPSAR